MTPHYVVSAIVYVGIAAQLSSGATNLKDDCGRVPIFQNEFGVSINLTTEDNIPEDSNSEDDGDFRILHGLTAKPDEWPFIARINMCSRRTCFHCTGSLLNSRWILSAGHCGKTAEDESTSKLTADLGLYDLVTRDASARTVRLDKVVIHPDFSLEPLVHDLALFRISEKDPVKFNTHIQPVCLPSKTTGDVMSYTRNKKCYAVGYGMLEHDRFAISLQKLQVGVRDPDLCSTDIQDHLALEENTLCIGPNNADNIGASCRGDSGGPNLCYEPETDKWRVFGTVSYGPSVCDREAGDRWLTVATELAPYRSWILDTINQRTP